MNIKNIIEIYIIRSDVLIVTSIFLHIMNIEGIFENVTKKYTGYILRNDVTIAKSIFLQEVIM